MKKIRSRGFTLIELLVVIAIIGLLAAIILASLNTARQKGRDAKRVSDLQEIGNVMELANNGTTPTDLTGCATGSALSSCTAPTGLSTYNDPGGVTGPFTAKTGNTTAYNYTIFYTGTGTTQNYEVCAYLEAGSGTLGVGMINVSSANGGSVTSGCN